MAMYFMLFEVTPTAHHPETDVIAGGFVNCWIVADDIGRAVEIAQTAVREADWLVGAPDEAYETDPSDYLPEDETFEYVQQAIVDGEVYVFHVYPVDEEDNDESEA